MDKKQIEVLARQAVERIRSDYGLPSCGFLAGGAIANIVWELASGNKAIINDVDIFTLTEKKDFSEIENPRDYKENENKSYDNYHGDFRTGLKNYYRILDVKKEDIFNTIDYQSDPLIILRSFDINSTKVGYLIENDKIYCEDDFVDFINSGELKISSLRTPAHTSVRIIKKQKELNVKLNGFELNLCQHAIKYNLSDKNRFKKRYKDLYNEYFDGIKDYFTIERDSDIEGYLKIKYGKEEEIYKLIPLFEAKNDINEIFNLYNNAFFRDKNLNNICDVNEFLFFMRNIYGDKKLSSIYSELKIFYKNNPDYIDLDVDTNYKNIMLISRLLKYSTLRYSNMVIANLVDKSLSTQIKLVNKILGSFDDGVAISILQNVKIDEDVELDTITKLILELSVRTKMCTPGEVKNILNKSNIS